MPYSQQKTAHIKNKWSVCMGGRVVGVYPYPPPVTEDDLPLHLEVLV